MYSNITKLPQPQSLAPYSKFRLRIHHDSHTYADQSIFSLHRYNLEPHQCRVFQKIQVFGVSTHNRVFSLQKSNAFLQLTPVFLMYPKITISFLDRHKDYTTEFLDTTGPNLITVRELNQQPHQILQKSIGVSFEQVLNEALKNISISFKSDGHSNSGMLPSCQQLNLVKVCPAFWDGVFFLQPFSFTCSFSGK